MRYGTWNIIFTDDLSLGGTTPPEFSGAFFSDASQLAIAGYVPENAVIADFSYWNAAEVTEAEFLALAKAENPAATIDANGYIKFPSPEFAS